MTFAPQRKNNLQKVFSCLRHIWTDNKQTSWWVGQRGTWIFIRKPFANFPFPLHVFEQNRHCTQRAGQRQLKRLFFVWQSSGRKENSNEQELRWDNGDNFTEQGFIQHGPNKPYFEDGMGVFLSFLHLLPEKISWPKERSRFGGVFFQATPKTRTKEKYDKHSERDKWGKKNPRAILCAIVTKA